MESATKRRRCGAPPIWGWGHEKFTILGVDIGIRNLSLCKLQLSEQGTDILSKLTTQVSPLQRWKVLCPYVTIQEWDVIDLINGKSVKGACHSRLLDSLHDYFTTLPGNRYLDEVNLIVIESQMTAKMKMISAGVYMLSKTLVPAPSLVQFQTASKKLAFDSYECQNEFGFPIHSETYAQRKKSAINLCKAFLEHHPILVQNCNNNFFTSKKKDDLADSFLHAIYALSDSKLYSSWEKHMKSQIHASVESGSDIAPAMRAS